MARKYTKKPPDLLLLRHVDVCSSTQCWIWNGSKYNSGYGVFRFNEAPTGAHRVSYMLFNGKIKQGNVVMHSCDNKLCINPNHLLQGTQKDNIADMYSKNRAYVGDRHHCTKLSCADVIEIRSSSMDRSDLARIYNTTTDYIYQIQSNKRRKNVNKTL